MFYTRYYVALIIMSRILTKEECLQLDIETYNKAMELQWKTDKVKKNLSGDLSNCEHCGRKYVICCICDEAEKRWSDMIAEVQLVSERDRSGEF
jgi:hypothetical protein